MSGHSKWSTIKHQKGVTDKKRGQAFSKAVKIITLAVKEGKSTDPSVNFRLRLAIDKAKAINMPKDNIAKAIARGSGAGGEGPDIKEVIYEGFGPHQSSLLVECVTDNTNRTLSAIKSYFDKRGGSLGSSGSVSYLFDKLGYVIVLKEPDADSQQLKIFDLNPIDVIEQENSFYILCPLVQLSQFAQKAKESALKILEMGIDYHAKIAIKWENHDWEKDLINFIEGLEELDDVEDVYTNIKL